MCLCVDTQMTERTGDSAVQQLQLHDNSKTNAIIALAVFILLSGHFIQSHFHIYHLCTSLSGSSAGYLQEESRLIAFA